MKLYRNVFEKIVSLENLFSAWDSFFHDKRKRADVQEFGYQLEENIFDLHRALQGQTYRHGSYIPFCICDPKPRIIHKATVRDRVVHHAIFRVINPIFEETFIANSFSCRVNYGTHKGVTVLEILLRKVSHNNTGACFVLKCDIRKFFDSIDHEILYEILSKRLKDRQVLWLLREIIESFSCVSERERERERVKTSAPTACP